MARPDSTLTGTAPGVAPRLVEGVNIRSLPIGPEEAFVLSYVDGMSSEADIAAATNLGSEAVSRILARLAALGAVAAGSSSSAHGVARTARPGPQQSGAYRIGPISETQEPRASRHPASVPDSSVPDSSVPDSSVPDSSVPDSALAEAVDLDHEQKQVLLDAYRRLESVNHYELLGVVELADAKAIRARYYSLVRVFHPDRYFGKNLGSYQQKLGKVFGRLTEAYEALRRSDSRAEYDRYLLARRRTLDFESQLHDASRQAAEVATVMERIEQAASSPHSSLPPSDPASRRRALARKLGHSTAPPPRASLAPPDPAAAARAAEDLKRRYESRLVRAREDQRDHYLALASAAEAKHDLAGAANAVRIACSLVPDDAALAAQLGELERRAASELWEAYAERGKYAAFEGRHAEAAESYERAAMGHSSASLFERAAFHSLESGRDLRRASQLAKQAVALAPHSAKCRLTLAQVYFAARLRESALAELERARALEPEQAVIKEWIGRVKRGEV